jgi:DNA-binding Lrp family transcriptional regulator
VFAGISTGVPSVPISSMSIARANVHKRIKKLEREGIIEGYKAIVKFEKTAWPIGALMMVNLAEVIPGKGHIPKKIF